MKTQKPIIHFFFPEASKKGEKIKSTEKWYLQYTYQRKMRNIQFKYYAEPDEKKFKKEIRSNNKKNGNDIFFIIFDTDQKEEKTNFEEIEKNIKEYEKEYRNYKNLNLVISNRSFEVWLCMFNETPYNKPFESQKKLEKDVSQDYEKTETWYANNAVRLFNNIQLALKNTLVARETCFSSSEVGHDNLDNLILCLPRELDPYTITWLVRKVNTYTYFDTLIKKIYNLNTFSKLLIEIDILVASKIDNKSLLEMLLLLKNDIYLGNEVIKNDEIIENLSKIMGDKGKKGIQAKTVLDSYLENF